MKSVTLIAIATVAATLVLGSLGTAEAGDYRHSYSSSYSGGRGHAIGQVIKATDRGISKTASHTG